MSTAEEPPTLTTTSFAILGLLAIKPWTTYELAVQMERTLNRVWPRARSRLYNEPQKLVAHGLAVATKGAVGRRPRTIYTITPPGREALAKWLNTPGSGPSLEYEHLVKIFFADHGTKSDALVTLQAARTWAAEQLDDLAEAARDYLAGQGPFPERSAVTSVSARFMIDFYRTIDQWADWATSVVQTWPDDPKEAQPDHDLDRYILELAAHRQRDASAPMTTDNERTADAGA